MSRKGGGAAWRGRFPQMGGFIFGVVALKTQSDRSAMLPPFG